MYNPGKEWRLTTTVLLMQQPPQARATVCECPQARCRFSVRLVKLYLFAARQARILREPLADVLRSEIRNSRPVDPWLRGGRNTDPEIFRDIALSVERARDEGGIDITNPWNAERVAAFCCPLRYDED